MYVVKCISDLKENDVTFLEGNTYLCYNDIFDHIVCDSRGIELAFEKSEFEEFFEII